MFSASPRKSAAKVMILVISTNGQTANKRGSTGRVREGHNRGGKDGLGVPYPGGSEHSIAVKEIKPCVGFHSLSV
jgi:hypothetical protein